MRTFFFLLAFFSIAGLVRSQTAIPSARLAPRPKGQDTVRTTAAIDSTLPFSPLPENGFWRRPQVERDGASMNFTGEAIRFYGSPNTVPELLEESGGIFPLVLSDESYGRESFVSTPRMTEDIASTLMDGVLPMNSILNGVSLTNYFPLDAFNAIRISSAAAGSSRTGADYAASDALDFTIERFRAPVPYSRIHYSQDLARDNSNFDGLFSLNASRETNLTFAIHRHASGSTPAPYDLTFNPRTDMWSGRVQMTIDHYMGTLPQDSTMTPHKRDSILATSSAQAKTLDFLVWGQYTTAFSGLNGGIFEIDTNDVFDQIKAEAQDLNTSDHRTRADALVELQMPLLAEARTKLAAYGSYEARTIITPDPFFPTWVNHSAEGTRAGLALDQPLTLSIGDFVTSAHLRGDAERVTKDSTMTTDHFISESRLSATASDSLALHTSLRIALFGFARTIESNLSIAGGTTNAQVLPSIGFSGSIGLTDAISLHASYQYSKDRAVLSPSPEKTYSLQNLGGWFDAHFPFANRDSISLHAGYLDRNEPEGIIYPNPSDTVRTVPIFSNANFHSQSVTLAFDAYFSHYHWGTSATYFPKTSPLSAYTETLSLQSPLPNRFFGYTGLFYENEFNQGNFRLSVGPRVRLMSALDPQLSYDPASDYYVYRGSAYTIIGDSLFRLASLDSRLTSPQCMVDLLVSAEVDRRAQVSMEFLNVLGAPDYNVALYPRNGFHWRLDVVWAFLD